MLGHAAIAETALADVGGVLQVATAEMSGISSASSVGVGELVGVATLDANFTKTTAGILITGSVVAPSAYATQIKPAPSHRRGETPCTSPP